MATGGGYEIETDGGMVDRCRSKDRPSPTVDIIKTVRVVSYRIPKFFTVELKHVVSSAWDDAQDKVRQFDIFMRDSPDIDSYVPCSLEIVESCMVPVEEFSIEIETKELCLPDAGVLIIWKWNWLKCDKSESDNDNKSSDTDDDDDSEPEEESPRSEKLVFKCIGTTKSSNYQSTLRTVRDKRLNGCTVPVRLVHEPLNPRDSRAIAFMCELDGKFCTIGYVVSELLEEVHAAMDSNSIVSVEFAWVRYVTDWSRSGPGFFAGVTVEKKGDWSSNARRAASTR